MNITDWVGVPLAALLGWCYDLLHSYGWAIIVFTLLTKVILFPVSMWVQKNSIAMVKLTPEINRLKIKYYGDKDTIAEETQVLYKREHYHPMASIIPMLVQLVLLIGVIGAVKSVVGEADTVLTKMPSVDGGWTYLMPLGAGLAALALGFAQNKLNPLQREQGVAEQWMTNGFSIAISLFLGAFVSLGVGMYWIFSNLFSILQQMLLNVVIKPSKYIDYEELAKSKKELEEINNLSEKVSKEDKKREKADYKKFFSVANKHLVFYSEKSGFYKYFKDVIEYLLEKSNVVIHYVTSDPKDQIFKIAEAQPRIRPYYIGENRLITLMMKMDADIVVMTCPDIENYHLKRSYVRKDIEYIYMFHYPLSTHMVLHTGALDHYDTIFCVGEFQFDEIRAAERVYNLPAKNLIAAGYGQLEQLHESYQAMEKVERTHPKVLIAPSWQYDNILDSCIDPMLEALLGKGFEVVVRPHPEYVKRYKPRMDAIVERYKGREADGLTFELDFTGNNSIFDSDILITDWSGTAYEFSFVTLKPAVFIDTKPKINNPEYVKLDIEPLEFSLRSQVGVQVKPDDLGDLDEKIRQLIANGGDYADQILAIREKYIANFGKSGPVGGRYILQQLKKRQSK
ncbi:MAG: membrane protein insertase YidC [Clostridia bacterium]|nr:membrane protein insertase YidC [Clostridia bacterium]